jgi:hypothetical protein
MGRPGAGGVPEFGRRLELAPGTDHLGAALPLRLGLAGHGALHHLRDLDVLDLHDLRVDAPRFGLVGDGGRQVLVEIGPVGQEGVELGPADDRSQRGLGDLGRGDRVVLDLHHGFDGVHHPEQHHGVDPGRDVVARDHLLRRDGEGDHTKVDPDQPVETGEDEQHPRAERAAEPSQPEYDRTLVFAHDPQTPYEDGDQHGGRDEHDDDGVKRQIHQILLGRSER